MRYVKVYRFISFDLLFAAKIISIQRDSNNSVIPIKKHIKKGDDVIYIKYGQLNSQNQIYGLGRNIQLKIYKKDDKGRIIDYVADDTLIDEGELVND